MKPSNTKDFTTIINAANSKNILTLINGNRSINSKDSQGLTLLHYAVLMNRQDIVKLLLKNGADVNCSNYESITPLHCAAKGNNEKIVKMLLNYGADVNAQTIIKWSPLHYAIVDPKTCSKVYQLPESTFKKSILKLLLKNGAFVNHKTLDSWTALHYAVLLHSEQIVSLLLEFGANPNIRNGIKMFPIHQAIERQSVEIVELLLLHGATATARDFLGKIPLLYAAERLAKDILELVLDHTVELNYQMLENFSQNIVYRERERIVTDLLTMHMIKLEKLGLINDKQTLEYLSDKMNDFQDKCEKEVRLMKREYIYTDCNVTFYDFLRQDVNKIWLYIKNEESRRELVTSFYLVDFPEYFTMIDQRIRVALKKVELFDDTHALLRMLLSNVLELPRDASLKILSYFSDANMKYFHNCHKL